MAQKYFEVELHRSFTNGFKMEWRSQIALELIRAFGAIAGKRGSDDSSGKSTLDLQTPEELVERCFKIADLYMATVEQRGDIQPATVSEEQKAAFFGKLEGIKSEGSMWQSRDARKEEYAKLLASLLPD